MDEVKKYIAKSPLSGIIENTCDAILKSEYAQVDFEIHFSHVLSIANFSGKIDIIQKEKNFLDFIKDITLKSNVYDLGILSFNTLNQPNTNSFILKFTSIKEPDSCYNGLGYFIILQWHDTPDDGTQKKNLASLLNLLHLNLNFTPKFELLKSYLSTEEQKLFAARQIILSELQETSKN